MHPAEYDRMASLEGAHWWYRGFRDVIRRILERWSPPTADVQALDAGCGTGENMRLLQAVLRPAYLAGFDIAEAAVAYARLKCPEADVSVGDVCRPELGQPRFDVVLCADVIYMTGLDTALPGLHTLVSHLSPGGLFVLHVPAYNWLYSRHDVAVGTRQRFRLAEIRELLKQLGLIRDVLSYRVCLLFPFVLAARLPSLLFGAATRKGAASASDLALPPRWLNAWLAWVLAVENWLIVRGVRLPCGSSIIAVGRKP